MNSLFIFLGAEKKPQIIANSILFPECAIAEPTKEAYSDNEHWADYLVTEEKEEEIALKPKKKRRPSRSKNPYFCTLCDAIASNVERFLQHAISKHTFILDRLFFICGFCKMKFNSEDKLERHVKKHIPKKNPTQKRFTHSERQILEDALYNGSSNSEEVQQELAAKLHVNLQKIKSWFSARRSAKKRQALQ